MNQFGYADIGNTDDFGLFKYLALVSSCLRHHQAVFGVTVVKLDEMPSGTGLRHAFFFRVNDVVTRIVLEEVVDFELLR